MSSSASRPILQPRSRLNSTNQTGLQGGGSSSTGTSLQPTTLTQQPFRHKSLDQMTFEELQRIHAASTIRESNDLLVRAAMERNESLHQTKLHFDREMLLIDSDIEDPGGKHDGDNDSENSIEWPDDFEPDSEDDRRLKPGIVYGPAGWWDPKIHKSAEERIQEEIEKKQKAQQEAGEADASRKVRVKSEGRTPDRKQKGVAGGSSGGRRRSSGKRAMRSGSASSQG